jgi:DNA replication regulator SLD3
MISQPYPSAGFVKPRSLQPLIILPRADLPLSSLDLISSSNSLPQSRLFETHVKILELEERMGSQPMVLIARLDDGRTLYAVEREDRGLYVLCKLGSWVNLRQLREAAVVSKQELPRALERKSSVQQESAPVALTTPESSKYSKKKRLAIEAIQSLVKRPSTGLLTESQPVTTEPEPICNSQPVKGIVEHPLVDDPAPPTAAEIFENVRLTLVRLLLRILPKDPFREHEQHSTSILTLLSI